MVYYVGFDRTKVAMWSDLLSGKQSVWQAAVSKFKKVNTAGNKMRFTPYYEVFALCKVKDGTRKGDGALLLGMKGSKEGQYYFFTGGVTLTGEIGARFNFTYSESDFNTGLAVLGRLGVKIFGGVGLAYVGHLGLYGNAVLDVQATVKPTDDAGWDYAKLKGTAGVEAVFCGWVVGHKELWSKGPYDLFTPRKSPLQGMSEGDVGDDLMGPTLTAAANDGFVMEPLAYNATSAGDWEGDAYVSDKGSAAGGGQGGSSGDNVRTSNLSVTLMLYAT